jgi:hypothetical protein
MPLRDHFRPPVNAHHRWNEVHGLWPGMLVRQLFDLLPENYQAAPNIVLGGMFEIDVSTFEDDTAAASELNDRISTSDAVEQSPAPTITIEAEIGHQDTYEVRVYDEQRQRQLVAAIEIISPANKDRPESRQTFLAKIATLLQQGVCVSIIDLVTIRRFNLYDGLLEMLERDDPQLTTTPADIYAVTLRTRHPNQQRSLLDVWYYPMELGQRLPTLPIWLNQDHHIMLDLELSYEETCRLLRIR